MAQGLENNSPPDGLDHVRIDYSLADCLERLAKRDGTTPYGQLVLDSFGLVCGGNPESTRFAIPFFRQLRSLGCTVRILDGQGCGSVGVTS